jgi:hypothetical protein
LVFEDFADKVGNAFTLIDAGGRSHPLVLRKIEPWSNGRWRCVPISISATNTEVLRKGAPLSYFSIQKLIFSEIFCCLRSSEPSYIEKYSIPLAALCCLILTVGAMTSPLEQKKIKVTGPVVVTANRVGDGAVVYRRADGSWTTRLDAAAVATNAAGAQELMSGAVADDLGAVGPYVAPVKLLPGGHVQPGNLRELIRLGGPTIELPAAFEAERASEKIAAHVRL